MGFLLGWFERATTRRPGTVIGVLVAITLVLGGLASTLEIEVDLTQFGSEDSSAVQANERIRDQFGDPAATVQVILDSGEDGNILTADGLSTLAGAEARVVAALGADARLDESGAPIVRSARHPIEAALGQQEVRLQDATDSQVNAIASQALGNQPELAALLSDDFNRQDGTARGAALIAFLDPALTNDQRQTAAERIAEAFGIESGEPIVEFESTSLTVFSDGLFVSGLTDAIRSELPQLFGLALLVVVVILALMYRSIFDVVSGLLGLVVTVVWTIGFIALLGPGVLGWTGPFSQMGVIVPVLLVGLGIDYSVHLTSRYREQRAAGDDPPKAARLSIRTVGTALILATIGTAVGFGGNAIAPVQMIADFGIFVAIGVVSALVVMGLLVPSARVLRDRRQRSPESAAVRSIGLGRLMRAPTWLALRAPAAGLAVAIVLAILSLAAATGLVVEFDRDDFIPEGSDVETVLSMQRDLFGANLNEITFAVIDADFTDPEVVNAVFESQSNLAGIEGVRSIDGQPQIRSIATLASSATRQTETAGDLGPAEGGFRDGTNMGALFGMLRQAVGENQVNQFLAADNQAGLIQIQTTAGDAGAHRLRAEVERALTPVEEVGASVAVTSEPIIMAEMSDDLASFQAQSIGITLVIVLILLATYYRVTHRSTMLGVIAMIPAAVAASLVLGVMWLMDISFNVLTATLTAVAIGIGVPYGVHVVNRFVQDREEINSLAEASKRTLDRTGGALTGSALTTLGAFAVLSFSGLPPIQSLGLLGGFSIAFALLAALLVEPGALVLWDRWVNRGQLESAVGVSPSSATAGPRPMDH